MQTSTIDPEEIERFTRMADEWWDPNGKFKPLHVINPLRAEWILKKSAELRVHSAEQEPYSALTTQHSPLHGLSVLDIGCGGGLISEAMARAGAKVTGIDAGEKNIKVAQLHAQKSGLEIDYRYMSAEALVTEDAQFDIVLALEIVEHVADVSAFVQATCTLVRPGGLIIYSTINRTAKSFALAIIGAEYVLRWLPRGTHQWKKFVKPSELVAELRKNTIDVREMTGLTMNPLTWQWRLEPKDLEVNYLVAGRKGN